MFVFHTELTSSNQYIFWHAERKIFWNVKTRLVNTIFFSSIRRSFIIVHKMSLSTFNIIARNTSFKIFCCISIGCTLDPTKKIMSEIICFLDIWIFTKLNKYSQLKCKFFWACLNLVIYSNVVLCRKICLVVLYSFLFVFTLYIRAIFLIYSEEPIIIQIIQLHLKHF